MSDSNCRECKAFLFADEEGQQICDDCFEVEKRKLAGTYFEPGSTEQREFVLSRELVELQNIVKSFDRVIVDAQNLADECKASADRVAAIMAEQNLDQKIDEADYAMKRGEYSYLRDKDSIMGKFDSLVADFKGLKI